MLQVPVPSVQIIRAVLREYHAATHTAEVEPVLGPASLVGEIPVLMSCRPDLLTTGREVAVLTWSDVGGLVLGPYGGVPDDPPNAGDANTVDGIHASATATANKLLALNASSKLPASITGDADTVDSIHAAASATANKLLALNASSKLPASITGDADTVDGIHASGSPTANKLLAMDAEAKFPAHTVSGLLTLDANLLQHYSTTSRRYSLQGYKGSAVNNTFFDVMNFTAGQPPHSSGSTMLSGILTVSIRSTESGGKGQHYGELFHIATCQNVAMTALTVRVTSLSVQELSQEAFTVTVQEKAGAGGQAVTLEMKVTHADWVANRCNVAWHYDAVRVARYPGYEIVPAVA